MKIYREYIHLYYQRSFGFVFFFISKKKQKIFITISLIQTNDELNHYNLHDYEQFQLHRIEFEQLELYFHYYIHLWNQYVLMYHNYNLQLILEILHKMISKARKTNKS